MGGMSRRLELLLYAAYMPLVMVMTLWGVYGYDAVSRWPEGWGWFGIGVFSAVVAGVGSLMWHRLTAPDGRVSIPRAAGVSALAAVLGQWLFGVLTAIIEFMMVGTQSVTSLAQSAAAYFFIALIFSALPGALWGLMFIALINRFRRAKQPEPATSPSE